MHLSLPLTVTAAGGLAALQVDSDVAVAQSVALLLDTRPGERRSVEEYGIPEQVFSTLGMDPADVEEIADEWEPRSTPALVDAALERHTQTVSAHLREE